MELGFNLTAFLGSALGGPRRLVARALAGWEGRLGRSMRRAGPVSVESGLGAFTLVMIAVDDQRARLIAGEASLRSLAQSLKIEAPGPEALIAALGRLDPEFDRQMRSLIENGRAFSLALSGADDLKAQGRTLGALALVKLWRGPAVASATPAQSLAVFTEERPEPCWIIDPAGRPSWVNRAWLASVGAESLADANRRGLSLDGEAERMAREAATSGQARTVLRWVRIGGERRALRFRAQPLAGGGAGVWSDDVTDAELAAERLGRQEEAQEVMFEMVADAVAVFGSDRRLMFHNTAFAGLWGLEPAWLADRPTHGRILDRLRQGGRLPEQDDYMRFRTLELARHEELAQSPETIWRLPDERTLKVVSRPHPRGGLLMVFSDVTPELRLRSQFNHLLQVQQATLDKLSDAVAVFGADGRLRLHNEAFEKFWLLSGAQLSSGLEFDALMELGRRRLHDLQFWRDLKGRITDPDPGARAAAQAELITADRRTVSHQSRPLPDGATLISFADITDARRLERALAEREAALSDAERLKREFVGSVSYELRTPLTTILGYAELLDQEGQGLDPRARAHLGSIRTAAAHLARSIDNVLDMAQFDAGDVAPDMGDVDVAALMAEAAERWLGRADEQGIALEAALNGELGLIRADGRRLAEVLDHLVENALRHTPAGGSVTLSAERALGEVRLQVSDTGRGIPFHVQAHIFDRFSGHDRASSGLGLALVKALVELHGGWVALESEPGSGATFTCHLPETADVPQARPELF